MCHEVGLNGRSSKSSKGRRFQKRQGIHQIFERSQVSREQGITRFSVDGVLRVGQDGPEKTTNAQCLTVETQKRTKEKTAESRYGRERTKDNTQQVSQQDWPRLLVSPNAEQVRAPRTPHRKDTLGIAVKFMFCCCQFDLLFSKSAVHFFVTGIHCFFGVWPACWPMVTEHMSCHAVPGCNISSKNS